MAEEQEILERIIEQESIFEGNYLNLEKVRVALPDGRIADREIVRVKDAVAILPLGADGTVHLVRQGRPAINKTIIEVPAGLVDQGETPAQAARRECAEEIGFRPAKLRKLLRYAHAEGYSDGFTTLYLGTVLERVENQQLDSSEYLQRITLPLYELLRRVRENQILDSKTILCALLAEKVMRENGFSPAGGEQLDSCCRSDDDMVSGT